MVAVVAKNVHKDLLETAYTLGAKRFQVIRKVLLPASLPGILDTLRIIVGWAWTYIIGGLSWWPRHRGSAYMIISSQRMLRTSNIIFGDSDHRNAGSDYGLFFQAVWINVYSPGWIEIVAETKLHINNVTKVYDVGPQEVLAIDQIDLKIRNKEFAQIILGPSGCGKSTLLRIVAGLTKPSSGVVRMDGKVITEPGQDRGMVFQSYTLFPWLTVRQNIEFGLEIAGMDKRKQEQISPGVCGEGRPEGFRANLPQRPLRRDEAARGHRPCPGEQPGDPSAG